MGIQKIEDALNKHINLELYSSYAYLSMSSFFQAQNLPGFAHWMLLQSEEERTHAMKFFSYINDRGGRVILSAIEKPETSWNNPLDVMKAALNAEQTVATKINDLVELSLSLKDHATYNFLQWFVSEQVEEEASIRDIISQLEMIENSKSALFLLDKELNKRIMVNAEPTN